MSKKVEVNMRDIVENDAGQRERANKLEAEVERLRELVTKLQVEANEQARLRGQPRP